MKRLLLFLSFALVSAISANAQCTPDPQYTQPGIYPDSATGFASGCENQLYEEVITVVVPVDTTVEIIPGFPTTLAFDSIVIVNFQGLPASGNLTYACNSSLGNCSFAGGSTGCVIIQGTPNASDVGTHNLVITVDVYVGGLGSPQTQEIIDWYYIEIQDAASCTNGIGEQYIAKLSAYPNPTDNVITIDGVNSEMITITDLNGKILMEVPSNGTEKVEINVSALDNGIYVANTSNGMVRFVKK